MTLERNSTKEGKKPGEKEKNEYQKPELTKYRKSLQHAAAARLSSP